MPQEYTRREFLRTVALRVTALALVACMNPEQESTTTSRATKTPTPKPTATETPKPTATKPTATKTPERILQIAQKLWPELRNAILNIDETAVAWPTLGEQEGGIPYHDEPNFEGESVRDRSRLTIKTGTNDFEMVTGGRFAGKGWVVSQDIEGVRVQGVTHPEGEQVYIDPKSGQVLFVRQGEKIIFPGGNDDDKEKPYLRGNIIFVLGKPDDNTATDLEVDTASNYREKRIGAEGLNGELDKDGVTLLAAMAKVYANSMFGGNNCKGSGCQSGVGIYIIRGGDKNTGREAELLWAAVLSPEELSLIALK